MTESRRTQAPLQRHCPHTDHTVNSVAQGDELRGSPEAHCASEVGQRHATNDAQRAACSAAHVLRELPASPPRIPSWGSAHSGAALTRALAYASSPIPNLHRQPHHHPKLRSATVPACDTNGKDSRGAAFPCHSYPLSRSCGLPIELPFQEQAQITSKG